MLSSLCQNMFPYRYQSTLTLNVLQQNFWYAPSNRLVKVGDYYSEWKLVWIMDDKTAYNSPVCCCNFDVHSISVHYTVHLLCVHYSIFIYIFSFICCWSTQFTLLHPLFSVWPSATKFHSDVHCWCIAWMIINSDLKN